MDEPRIPLSEPHDPQQPPHPPTQSLQQQQQQQQQHKPSSRLQRSCITCRRRKVRCDKNKPCRNCAKARIECVFPQPGQSGDRPHAADPELLGRLQGLESVLKTLINCIGEDRLNAALHGAGQSDTQSLPHPSDPRSPPPPLPVPHHHGGPAQPNTPFWTSGPSPGSESSPAEPTSWTPYGKASGKLVKDGGRDTYISGTFWESLHAGVEDVRELMEGSEYGAEYDSPSSVDSPQGIEFLFEGTFRHVDVHTLHPPPHLRFKAWELFKANVHPVATVLHIPSVEPAILEAMTTLQNVSRPMQVLLFVVYYGAVTSLPADECQSVFGEEQSLLFGKYRLGLQQTFSRAKLMNTDDFLVLGSFVLFLVLLRHHDPRLSWNLTGLAVRLLESLGMHRDGSSLNLSKFDAEMRRRLWWNLCVLDTPASEDRSCTPTILEMSSFDASLPLNLNDSDLDPNMTEYPPESGQLTDICLTLLRCTLTNMWRTMIDTRRLVGNPGKSFASMTMAEKEVWLGEQQHELQRKFIADSSSVDPLHWVVATLVRSISCTLRLCVYNPLRPDVTLSEEDRDKVFVTAVECIEHSHRLRTDSRAKRWAWLLNGYHEWFALTIVLMELCRRPMGKNVDRAWRIIEQSVVLRWESPIDHRGSHQWRSIMLAMEKARAARRRALQRPASGSAPHSASSSIHQHPFPQTPQPCPAGILPSPALLNLANVATPGPMDPGPPSHNMDHSSRTEGPRLLSPMQDLGHFAVDMDAYMFDVDTFNQQILGDNPPGMIDWGEPATDFDAQTDHHGLT